MDEKIKTWTLRFPAKENPNMEKVLLDWPFVLQHDVKAKYRLISRKFSGMTFFHPSVRLTIITNQSHARLHPFDKPIKSLYFRSFVVSVLFACFHFKENRSNDDVDYDDDDTGKDDEDEHDYDHRQPRTSRSHVTTCRQVIELFLIETQFWRQLLS